MDIDNSVAKAQERGWRLGGCTEVGEGDISNSVTVKKKKKMHHEERRGKANEKGFEPFTGIHWKFQKQIT